jgi:hypothetical protein
LFGDEQAHVWRRLTLNNTKDLCVSGSLGNYLLVNVVDFIHRRGRRLAFALFPIRRGNVSSDAVDEIGKTADLRALASLTRPSAYDRKPRFAPFLAWNRYRI